MCLPPPPNRIFIYVILFQETIKLERLRGGESSHNCGLIATLKMFFSSATSANKNSGPEKQDSEASEEEE